MASHVLLSVQAESPDFVFMHVNTTEMTVATLGRCDKSRGLTIATDILIIFLLPITKQLKCLKYF